MVHEIVIGIVLGATARVTLSALAVAGSVIAQQLGLGFVTAVDPTQGQQGLLIGNFLTILGMTLLFATDSHHLVIAALNESYRIFSPGEVMPSGDVAALATRAFATAFKIGMQLSAPFLVFGLVFNIGLGVLARLMPAMQVYFVGVPLSIMVGFLIFALRPHRNDGDLSQLLHRRDARADAAEIAHDPGNARFQGTGYSPATNAERVCAEIMLKQDARTPRWPTIPTTKQKTLRKSVSTMRLKKATSPRARRSIPGSSSRAPR